MALAEGIVPVKSSGSKNFGELDKANIDLDMLEKIEEFIRDFQSQTLAKPRVEDSCNPLVLAYQLI